eukprot:TRINITY_DN9522_c0_g3_i1.p1 TRINITY_DN9522_c0_g3~~TRINITY_DN9522_c0_g3_i1.p1  ORF type:complete len:269 (+),score=82.89 TRINITY_DN9522_c0_g3_i1:47-808(+)
MLRALLITVLAGAAAAEVAQLTSANFKDEVSDGRYWMVGFTAKWCKRCKGMESAFAKIAKGSGETLQMAMFDTDQEDKSAMEQYEIEGLPAIILVKPDGNWKEYAGERDVDGLKAFILKETGLTIKTKKPKKKGSASTVGQLLTLTHENMTRVMEDTSKNVLVKFYAPWCRACTETVAVWNELAETNTDEDLVIAKLNCEHDEPMKFVCWDKFEIRGYPAIMMFSKNDKSGKKRFTGSRFKPNFLEFIKENQD